jgi:hypothetical protein
VEEVKEIPTQKKTVNELEKSENFIQNIKSKKDMEVVKNKEELNKKRDKENPDKLQPERENTMKEIPGKKYSIDSINIEAFNLKTDQRICKNCLKVTLDNSKCNGCHL